MESAIMRRMTCLLMFLALPLAMRADDEPKRDPLRDVNVQPADMKPLFHGKDLTGWKEFPGKKSKFSVTSEGWLHIENGPGDLQTEELYGDFVLQLECKTNGK